MLLEDKLKELHSAVEHNNLKTVRKYLKGGLFGLGEKLDINKQNYEGFTPLTLAAMYGSTETAEFLLENGADVNCSDKNGYTPLMGASKYGHTKIASMLAGSGADVNAAKTDRGKGWTALLFALSCEHPDIARLLLENGADFNVIDENNYTPLLYACKHGYTDIAKLIIDKGCDINIIEKTDNFTPLLFAARECRTDIVRLLLENGADHDYSQSNGWTALTLASYNGCSDIIELLLEKGADMNHRDKAGEDSIDKAVKQGHEESFKIFIKYGISSTKISNTEKPLIFMLIEKNMLKSLDLLIQHKDVETDLNIRDINGQTALMIAARSRNNSAINLLLDFGSDIDASDNNGWTALMRAVEANAFQAANTLLQRKCDPNKKTSGGFTALDLVRKYRSSKLKAPLEASGALYGDPEGCMKAFEIPGSFIPGYGPGNLPWIDKQAFQIKLVPSNSLGDGGNGKDYFNTAIQHLNQKRDSEALVYFQNALEAGLESLHESYVHANIGGIRLREGNIYKAVESFISVLSYDKALFESVHDAAGYMAVIYDEMGRKEEADRFYSLVTLTGSHLGISLSSAEEQRIRRLAKERCS